MSLEDYNFRNRFREKMCSAWTNWLVPPPTYHRASRIMRVWARKNRISEAINLCSAFMPPPRILFEPLPGSVGAFRHQTWTLRIDDSPVSLDQIRYKNFIDLCATVYHELRHGEQAYRIAQGLALGPPDGLDFPDVSAAQKIQEIALELQPASYGRRFAAYKRAFQSAESWREDADARVRIIARWLNMPQGVIRHADANRNLFRDFIRREKPSWFLRHTVKEEVDDWMRSSYKKGLGAMEWAIEHHMNLVGNIGKMYRALPMERDAFGIERFIERAMKILIGDYEQHKNVQRTNVEVFGGQWGYGD